MGRATIVSGGTDGLYTIEVDYGTAERDAKVADLTARKAELQSLVTTLEGFVSDYEAEEAAAKSNLDSAIAAYNISGDKAPLREATSALHIIQGDKRTQTTKLGTANLELSGIDAQIDQLNALVLTETKQAWCADYTQLGTGEVGTIDVEGESNKTLIVPGCRRSQAYDGYFSHTAVMSAEQTYHSLAIKPGWQKFKPTYRFGTITSVDVDTNTCSVNLDAALSDQQNLNINQSGSLTGVPVEYMTCHAVVFDVDDRVVVQFSGQDWSQPKVIGFEDNPKPCYAKRIFFPLIAWQRTNFATTNSRTSWYFSRSFADTEPSPELIERDFTFAASGPTPSQGYAAGTWIISGSWEDGAIYFDGAWYQDTGIDERYIRQTSGYTVQGYTTHAVFTSKQLYFSDFIDGNSASSAKDNITYISYNFPPGSPSEYGNPWDVITGTREESTYKLAAATYATRQEGPVAQDRAHVDAWIRERWNMPPETIQVDIGGEWIQYELESIGVRPDNFQDWDASIGIDTPVGADSYYSGKPTYYLTPDQTAGAIYRQTDYSADE